MNNTACKSINPISSKIFITHLHHKVQVLPPHYHNWLIINNITISHSICMKLNLHHLPTWIGNSFPWKTLCQLILSWPLLPRDTMAPFITKAGDHLHLANHVEKYMYVKYRIVKENSSDWNISNAICAPIPWKDHSLVQSKDVINPFHDRITYPSTSKHIKDARCAPMHCPRITRSLDSTTPLHRSIKSVNPTTQVTWICWIWAGMRAMLVLLAAKKIIEIATYIFFLLYTREKKFSFCCFPAGCLRPPVFVFYFALPF